MKIKNFFKSILRIKYLILEMLIFFGSLITFLAITIYFIDKILDPFLSSFPNVVAGIFAICFIVFYVFVFISFASWILQKVNLFTRHILEIFIK